jgi:hypothetical protein
VVPSDAYNGEKEATAQVQILAWTLPSKWPWTPALIGGKMK